MKSSNYRTGIYQTKEYQNQIIELYNNGMSQVNIGKILNCSDYFVRSVLYKNNIHIRNNREQALKYTCDSNYFHQIDTEEKAYWLGFIAADGYVSSVRGKRLGISIGIIDQPHLKKFKQSINANCPIKIYHATGYTNNEYCRVIINNPQIYDDLVNKGVVEHKTGKLKFPIENQVPTQFVFDYIRGYYDGNGSIKHSNRNEFGFALVSTYEFLCGVQKIIGDNHHFRTRHEHDEEINVYSLEFGGNQQTYRQLSKLYDNAHIYLDRKYKRYLQLKKQLNY